MGHQFMYNDHFPVIFHRVVAVLLASIYMVLLYFLYIPNWSFDVSSLKSASLVSGSGTQAVSNDANHHILLRTTIFDLVFITYELIRNPPFLFLSFSREGENIYHFRLIYLILHRVFMYYQVYCGERGSLQPPCNAVGLIDRYFLGEQHLYQRPVYRRTKVLILKPS